MVPKNVTKLLIEPLIEKDIKGPGIFMKILFFITINKITNMSKSVRFSPEITTFITYSADEYDRSCFASCNPIQYTFAIPTVSTESTPMTTTSMIPTQQQDRPAIKPLDLSIIPNSRRRALDSPNTVETPRLNSKKPKLTINTQSLTPLFFSGLSTHYKCKNEDEEEEHGYLIPVMAC